MKDEAKQGLTQFGRQYLLEEKTVMQKRVKGAEKVTVELDAFIAAHTSFESIAKKAAKLLKKHEIECEDKEAEAPKKRKLA